MTILSSTRPVRTAVLSAAVALAASIAVVLSLSASPALAIVTTVGPVQVGLQPRSTWLGGAPGHESKPATFENRHGNPVLSASQTYAIYWDPTDHYHGDWQNLIDTFFQSVGAESGSFASVFSVDTQYTDAANQHALYKSTFHGAYIDSDEYPTSDCEDPHPLEAPDLIGPIVANKHTPICLTDNQIEGELERFITQHSLQKGMGSIFYLLTPPGVTVCLDGGGALGHCSDFKGSIAEVNVDERERATAEAEKKTYVEPEVYKSYKNSFCSYHSDISPTNSVTGDENTILYAVVPWIAGGLGDYRLTPADENTPAYLCQDGGWDASGKEGEKYEEKKEVKKNKKKEEEEPLTEEEKKKQERAEELEGPHQQEPDQVPCPSPDGFCDTGLADLIINQIGVEQQNIVTNPLLDAWQDEVHNEATDECRNDFEAVPMGGGVSASEETSAGTLSNQPLAGHNYYLNDAFNLAALKLPYPAIGCLPGIRLEPLFTAPNPVNAGELVGFDGMESDITLNAGTDYTPGGEPQETFATYTWNFGDGTPSVSGFAPGAPLVNSPGVAPCVAESPCAASTYHSYQYGGAYKVELTVTDVGGNTASVTEPITVVGPPAPSPAPTPSNTTPSGSSPGAGSAGSGGSSGSPPGQTGTASSVPPPVVTASIASTSLKKVKSSGIAVRYKVNEQVAGSVQVLLESAVAKRLGIKGPVATGLAKGSPSEIVIGTAVLVTTKAGNGTVRVKFASKTAARLARSHKLKLMLRLVVRNASRVHPLTTTTLSTVVLSG